MIIQSLYISCPTYNIGSHCQSYLTNFPIISLFDNNYSTMQRAQGYLHLSRTHLKYDCTSKKWEVRRIPCGTVDQIDVIIIIITIIIAGVSASDNAVPVWWSYCYILLSFCSNSCCCLRLSYSN